MSLFIPFTSPYRRLSRLTTRAGIALLASVAAAAPLAKPLSAASATAAFERGRIPTQ